MATYTDRLLVLSSSGVPTRIAASDTLELSLGNLVIGGDLTVKGDRLITNTETVVVEDNHLYVNSGHIGTSHRNGGLVVNSKVVDSKNTTGGEAGDPAVMYGVIDSGAGTITVLDDASMFAAGDLLQVHGSGVNDGLYEVLSHVGHVVTIKSSPELDFTDGSFKVDFVPSTHAEGQAVKVSKVEVSVLRFGADGVWETAHGSDASAFTGAFDPISTGSSSTLQAAYNASVLAGGATIETSGTNAITFDLTSGAGFNVDGGTIFFGASTELNSFQAKSAGILELDAADDSRFRVVGGVLTISAVGDDKNGISSGDLQLRSEAAIDMYAGVGGLQVNSVGSIDMQAGTNFSIDSSNGNSSISTTAGALVISTLAGTGDLDGVKDGITIDSAVDMDLYAVESISIESAIGQVSISALDNDANINSYSGNTGVTSHGGAVIIQTNTLASKDGPSTPAGNIAINSGAAIQMDAIATSYFNVDGASLTLSTTTSGDIIVDSVAAIQMDADAASWFKASAGDVTVDSEAASLILHGATSVDMTSALVTVDSTGAIQMDADAASWLKASAGDVTVDSEAASLILHGATSVDMTSALVTVDSTGAIQMDADAASWLKASAGDVTVDSEAASLILHGATSVDMTSALVTVDSTGAIEMDADAASYFTVAGADLTLSTTGLAGDVGVSAVGHVNVSGAAGVNIASGNSSIDLDVNNSIDIATDGTFGVVADSATFTIADNQASALLVKDGAGVEYVKLDTLDGSEFIIFDNANFEVRTGEIRLLKADSAGFAAEDYGSLYVMGDAVSASTELFFKSDGFQAVQLTKDGYLNPAAVASTALVAAASVSAGDALYIDSSGKLALADADAIASSNVVGFALAGANTDESVALFAMPGAVVSGLSVSASDATNFPLNPGKAVYLKAGGGLDTTPPSGASDVIFRVGFLTDVSAGANKKILFQPQFVAELPA